MIKPHEITDYNRTEAELQAFLCFAICVAGKSSKVVAAKLNDWWVLDCKNPFHRLTLFSREEIREELRDIRIGQYTRITNALFAIANAFANRSLKTATLEELTSVKGIGKKSARFFSSSFPTKSKTRVSRRTYSSLYEGKWHSRNSKGDSFGQKVRRVGEDLA